jgi:hypothetical protein
MIKTKIEEIVPYAVFEFTRKLSQAQTAINAFVDERLDEEDYIDVERIMNSVQVYMRSIQYDYIGLMKIADMWKEAANDD